MKEITKTSLDATRKFLNGLSGELIAELNSVTSGNWGLSKKNKPEDGFLLDIEVNADGYSLSLYPMDINSTQLGYRQLLEKYANGIFVGTDCALDTYQFDLDNEEDVNELDEFDAAQSKIFFEWFAECWDAAEKQTLNKPIYLRMHDSDSSYDLKDKKWVEDEEKWS